MKLKPCLFFVMVACFPFGVAFASDHSNLEEYLPTQLEDAYPIEYGGREIQSAFLFTRTSEGQSLFQVQPRLELGFAPNWQGALTLPYQFGSAVPNGLGDAALDVLYNFNTDGIWVPAVAVSARAEFPTAPDNRGVDTTAKLILTKGLGRTSFFNQLHINIAWIHNASPFEGERENLYKIVAGWSARINADTIGIIDYVREQQKEQGKTSDLVEAGVRRQVTPLLTLSAGAGVGLSKDSPDFRVTLGFQQSF